MDEAIKNTVIVPAMIFVSFAVDNLIADKLLDENDTVISEKAVKGYRRDERSTNLADRKSMFRYAVEMELIMRMFSEITDFTPREIEEMRKEAIRNVRRTRGKSPDWMICLNAKDTQSL